MQFSKNHDNSLTSINIILWCQYNADVKIASTSATEDLSVVPIAYPKESAYEDSQKVCKSSEYTLYILACNKNIWQFWLTFWRKAEFFPLKMKCYFSETVAQLSQMLWYTGIIFLKIWFIVHWIIFNLTFQIFLHHS